MKNYSMVVLVAAVLAVASIAVAGTMTWSKPLLSASDSTLGENMKIQKNKEAMEEMRTRIAAGLKFAGYSTQGN